MPWIKIIISVIAVGITVVEIWEFRKKRRNKKWEKWKKPIIVISSLLLLLLTVWDEISDENKNKDEENRRNAQIIKDSIRASNIITNLKTALFKIDNTALEISKSTENLTKVDSSIRKVNNGLSIQGNRLSRIINESQEVNKNLTGGDSYMKFYLIKNRKNKTIQLACGLVGKYPLQNIKISVSGSSFKEKIFQEPIKLAPLINGRGIFGSFDINFQGFNAVNFPYTLAIFNENDFKEDIFFSFWTSSSNGVTFQQIKWKNHKKHFAKPPKSSEFLLGDEMDWSGKEFEYYTSIDRIFHQSGTRNIRIDSIAGIIYANSHFLVYRTGKDAFTIRGIY